MSVVFDFFCHFRSEARFWINSCENLESVSNTVDLCMRGILPLYLICGMTGNNISSKLKTIK